MKNKLFFLFLDRVTCVRHEIKTCVRQKILTPIFVENISEDKTPDDMRGEHPSSVNNLMLRASSQKKYKVRCNFSILPENHKYLHDAKNGSQHLDELVEQARLGLIFTPQQKQIIVFLNQVLEGSLIGIKETKKIRRVLKFLR